MLVDWMNIYKNTYLYALSIVAKWQNKIIIFRTHTLLKSSIIQMTKHDIGK